MTETWEVHSTNGQTLYHPPEIRARFCSPVEKQKIAQRLELEMQQALADAQQARVLVVEGLEHDQHQIMGVYEIERRMLCGRAVWRSQGDGPERFIFYTAINRGGWLIGARKAVEARDFMGYAILVGSTASTPDGGWDGRWEVSDGSEFVPARQLRVRMRETQASNANWRVGWAD